MTTPEDTYTPEQFDEFDRWIAAHDAEVRVEVAATIVARVRSSCTPSLAAYQAGGDGLIAAVADWIENPPKWVDAPWRNPVTPQAGTP